MAVDDGWRRDRHTSALLIAAMVVVVAASASRTIAALSRRPGIAGADARSRGTITVLMPEHRRDRHDRMTLTIAVIALLAACVGTLFSAWQSWTAANQLALQRDFNVRQVRAYVAATDISPQALPTAGHQFVTILTLKNTGSTPAHQVRAVNFLASVRPDRVNIERLARRRQNPSATSIVLASQQEKTVIEESIQLVSQTQLDDYVEGNLAFISYGTVYYTDV